MKLHLLTGFLGSGKTSIIFHACKLLLRRGTRVGVITNDQGSQLVDGMLFRSLDVYEKQVGNGCFCCNYSDFQNHVDELISEARPEMIFAESVGTCTDIVATVMKPMMKYRMPVQVTLTAVVDARLLDMMITGSVHFKDDVRYIYFKQLEEAQTVLINKTDLTDELTLERLQAHIATEYKGKKILTQSIYEATFPATWLDHVNSVLPGSEPPSLNIDYDQYASGEALMAFLDQELVVQTTRNDAEHVAIRLMQHFKSSVESSGAVIGHIKCWVNDRIKVSFTSTGADDTERLQLLSTDTCTLLVSARVQTTPSELTAFMNASLEAISRRQDIFVESKSTKCFKPGYPRPLHRFD